MPDHVWPWSIDTTTPAAVAAYQPRSVTSNAPGGPADASPGLPVTACGPAEEHVPLGVDADQQVGHWPVQQREPGGRGQWLGPTRGPHVGDHLALCCRG